MKKILLILIISLFLSSSLYADTIKIPYVCSTQRIIKIFKRHGIVIDKSQDFKTKKSVGFIKNNGSNLDIIFYGSLTKEGLMQIREILVNEVMNGKI